MKPIFFFCIAGALSLVARSHAAAAEGCASTPEKYLAALKNIHADYELSHQAAYCLVRSHLGKNEVGAALLSFLKDEKSDALLKEDVIEALGNSSFRKTVRLEAVTSPQVGQAERAAAERTIASAGPLLAVAQAIDKTNETLPVTRYEAEFIRTLVGIAQDENQHVLLRTAAIEASEKILKSIVQSELYDEGLVRSASLDLRDLAASDHDANFYIGADLVFARLSSEPKINLAMSSSARGTRNISSVPNKQKSSQ